MDTGLLWYDDDLKRPLPLKVADAVARYRERLSHEPTVCYVNPRQATAAASTTPRGKGEPPRVRLVPDERVRPNYFLVAEEAPEDAQDAPPARPPLDAPTPQLAPVAAPRAARRTAHAAPPAHSAAMPDRGVVKAAAVQRTRRARAMPADGALVPRPVAAPIAVPPRRSRPAAPTPTSVPAAEPRQSARRATRPGTRARPTPATPTPAPVAAPTPVAPAPAAAARRTRRPHVERQPAHDKQVPRVAAPSTPVTPPAKSARPRKSAAVAVAQPSLFALLEPAPAQTPALAAQRRRRAS